MNLKLPSSNTWSQTCTYGLFTLFPILVFSLVLLWKSNISYTQDTSSLADNLNLVTLDLNNCRLGEQKKQEKVETTKAALLKLFEEKKRLENRTYVLTKAIKNVEAKALNLTSKLLVREVETGMLKEENRKLKDVVKTLKWKLNAEKQKQEKLEKEKVPSKIAGNTSAENSKVDIILHTNVNLIKEESTEQNSVKSENTSVEVKTGQSSSKAMSLATDEKVDDEMVDKLLEIKLKEKELNAEKKELISNMTKTMENETKEEEPDIPKVKIVTNSSPSPETNEKLAQNKTISISSNYINETTSADDEKKIHIVVDVKSHKFV